MTEQETLATQTVIQTLLERISTLEEHLAEAYFVIRAGPKLYKNTIASTVFDRAWNATEGVMMEPSDPAEHEEEHHH